MYGKPLDDFRAEVRRILEAARERKVLLRLVGALAFNLHCPRYGYLQARLGRVFTDIDFASYAEQSGDIRKLFQDLGYREDFMVTRLFGTGRLLFYDDVNGRHSDVFLDKLEFCHDVPLRGRLSADPLTIPLAELVAEKMQIVKINEKDIIDTIMLLREHPLGDSDEETVNSPLLARLCAQDWGLWRTMTMNLAKVKQQLEKYDLSDEDRAVVAERLEQLARRLDDEPKPLKWKLRDRVGDRVKWYRDVEELSR